MSRAIEVDSLEEIPQQDIVCITGGEPQLYPNKVKEAISWARSTSAQVYMYTTIFTIHTAELATLLDGIHFSLHDPVSLSDRFDFVAMQEVIRMQGNRSKSYRLYVESSINRELGIQPNLWKRIEVKGWSSEDELLAQQPNGLPAGETMYIWRQ